MSEEDLARQLAEGAPSMNTVAEVLAGGATAAVEQGEAESWLYSLPADSVDLLMCSGPYEDARAYKEGGADLKIARKTDAWVAWMLGVCRAASRACKGLCVFVVEGRTRGYRYSCSPFLLMADLHRAGFNLRKPPVFRRSGICGSGGPDWWRNDWEPVVCFSRPGRLPWSDNTATGRPPKYGPGGEMSHRTSSGRRVNERKPHTKTTRDGTKARQSYKPPKIANPGNVIACDVGGGSMGSPLAHENEAPYPESLVEPFVRCFCPPGGVVCDPFAGSGTTLAVAAKWGRRAIGADIRESQVLLTRCRLASVTPTLFPAG